MLRNFSIVLLQGSIFLMLGHAGVCGLTNLTGNNYDTIRQCEFGPDGYVYFAARHSLYGYQIIGSRTLYRVPQSGGPVTQLTPEFSDKNLGIDLFHFDAISNRIAFLFSDDNLYSVESSGGQPIQLTTTSNVPGGTSSPDFWLTPQGDRAVYLALNSSTGRTDMFSVPVDGAASPIRLNKPLPDPIGAVYAVTVMPGGDILYRAPQDFASELDLYRVSPGGGTPLRLNLTPGVGNYRPDYLLSPQGNFVLYRAGNLRLYRTDVSGGPEIALTPSLNMDRFFVSPDGNRALYTADSNGDGRMELFSVASSGGSSTTFTGLSANKPSVDGYDVVLGQRQNNSNAVAFRTDDSDGKSSFYFASANGGAATLLGRLSTPLYAAPPYSLQLSTNSDYLLVKSNDPTRSFAEEPLYAFPTSGGSPINFGDIDFYILYPDGVHIIYAVTAPSGYGQEVFWQRIDRTDQPLELTNGYTTDDITTAALSPDGSKLLLVTGQYYSGPDVVFVATLPVPEPQSIVLAFWAAGAGLLLALKHRKNL